MRGWRFVVMGVLAVASLRVVVAGQTATKPNATSAAKSSATLRTADGQPDLQGVWDFRTVTPMERPS
jgi:hypothetical protein